MSNQFSLVLLVSCFTLLSASTAHSERVLTSYADMTAVLKDDYKCSKTVPLTVRSSTDEAFVGDRVELQRLLGGLRIVVGFECPETENMIINGEVGGIQVFKGAAAKDQDWQLIVLIEPTVASGKADQPQKTEPAQEATSSPTVDAGIPNRDWCGQDGDSLPENALSFTTPDNLVGPFGDACRKHDECYAVKANKIIQSMEAKYKMTVASVDALEDYKTEASDLFEVEKSYCDGAFFGAVNNACVYNSKEASIDEVTSEKAAEKCASIATAYFNSVESRLGQKAFDRAVENALKLP